MYFKRLKPYMEELLSFVIIAIGFILFFTIEGYVTIKWRTITVAFAILAAIWFIEYVFSFVPFSICVVRDFICKDYKTVELQFLEQFTFKSSYLLKRNGKYIKGQGIEKIETLFYKVIVKDGEGIQTYTSAEYFPLIQNNTYHFVIGRKSLALVDVVELSAGQK